MQSEQGDYMLSLKINGEEKKLNIGCRTFISLVEMLKILKADVEIVTLNDEKINSQNYAQTFVKGGDVLVFNK
jgi:sulfur carrier protein ThiS